MGKLREKRYEGANQHLELLPSVGSVQYRNYGLLSNASVLEPILSDISSSDQELASLALRSLAYFLHNERFIADISDENALAIVKAICQLIMLTDKRALCSLAVWCLSIQELRPQVIESCLDLMLQGLLYVTESGSPVSSKAFIYEALQGIVKIAEKYPSARMKSSIWAPAIYRRLLSSDKKEREVAEECMQHLEFTLLVPLQRSLSEVVAVDIDKMLLPKLEKMVKSKALVLPAVRAWGWFMRLLGSLAGENRALVNQMLKIVELTFTSQDASVRNASLVAWEALIDALLQSPNVSEQQNISINVGVSLSAGQPEKSLLVLPLKRLKLLMVPLVSILSADKDQIVRLACWHTWQYLAHKLGPAVNQPSLIDVVVTPIFEAMFRFGPDKSQSSAWDLCLKALEDWICCKVQRKIDSCLSQALFISIPGKAPSPKTPTCRDAEYMTQSTLTIAWTPWSLEQIDVLLRLVKILWTYGISSLKDYCTRNLSLSGALRMFLLLVKGVESDGKGAVKPPKEHIDSVHSLLMFVNDASVQCLQTLGVQEVLLAVDSLIESLLDLQPLVLSSSFYKLALAPLNSQMKLGEDCTTYQRFDEDIEFRSADLVTPIAFLLYSWLQIASMADLSGQHRETFMKRLESLVAYAFTGFNVMGNLSGLSSVLDLFVFNSGGKVRVNEADITSLTLDITEESGGVYDTSNSSHFLMFWKILAEHTARYLEGSNGISAVEGVVGDSVLLRILLFPLRMYLQLHSLSLGDSDSAKSLVNLHAALNSWLKLFESASICSSRVCLQANSFASGLSQQILKLLEKEWQQQSNKGALIAELLAFVAVSVLKRTEPSDFAMLAINRKKRFGSYMGAGTANGMRGNKTEIASNVRNILAFSSRVLDLSCDECTAGQENWLDPAARLLEGLATFAARLNSQHDVLMFLEEFSKPYAKWLKFTKSCHDSKDKYSLTTIIQALKEAWQKHLHSLQTCHPPVPFDSNLLSIQALALVPAFQHCQTSISSCTVSFWEATYGSKASALKYPPCLVPVLKMVKINFNVSLPGWNRGCTDSSRRKSDVTCYTFTGRRCLQVLQEHLVDAQKNSPGSMGDVMLKSTSMVANRDSFPIVDSSMLSKIGCSTEQVGIKSAALPTGDSLVAPTCAAAVPKRKNLRFLDLKTFANASGPMCEDGLFPTTAKQSEVMDKVNRVSEVNGNNPSNINCSSTPSINETVQSSLPVEGPLCSTETSRTVGPSDRDMRILRRPKVRSTGEIKKLGVRKQRFLRSSGCLRGGKFWRDTSATVKGLQKIRKCAALSRAEHTYCTGYKTVNQPSFVKAKEDEASLKANRNFVSKAHAEQLPKTRGRPRSVGLANSNAAFDAFQPTKQSVPVSNVEEAGQQMQTCVQKSVDLGANINEKLPKKAFPESPFRVQTLNRGLYGKIFSSVVKQSNVFNGLALRSHHRKNSCPRRIPMLKDEEPDSLHSIPKVKLGKKAREAEHESGFQFTTPSKILRSGKKLKSRKWGTVSVADKMEDHGLGHTLQKAISSEDLKTSSHSRASAWHRADVGESVPAEPDLFSIGGSKFGSDILQVKSQFHQGTCESGKALGLAEPITTHKGNIFNFLGQIHSHGTSLSMDPSVFPENNGGLSTTPCHSLSNFEELVLTGARHRLCDLLAGMSASSEWCTMSLDDLDCAQKSLGMLQSLVAESKSRILIDQAAKV